MQDKAKSWPQFEDCKQEPKQQRIFMLSAFRQFKEGQRIHIGHTHGLLISCDLSLSIPPAAAVSRASGLFARWIDRGWPRGKGHCAGSRR